MSGRGHRAALPAGGHSRPEYLAGDEKGALAVRHYNRAGRVREYDFTALPVPAAMQVSLAALFAARCTPDRWSVHATSRRTWIYLRQFAGFLDGLRQQPRDLDELTPEVIRLWRESLSEAGGGAAFKTVSGLLRGDARLREGHAADELARRYRAPRSTVQSYSESEFGRITATARRQFRAALRRVSENAAHLQRWREGGFAEGSADWIIGEGLDILARTGACLSTPRRAASGPSSPGSTAGHSAGRTLRRRGSGCSCRGWKPWRWASCWWPSTGGTSR